ncbi:GNAT family N-acetyltransferase [Paenibacillus sp. GCM10027629]|uniref:GNAT family N-acetyltransferase n=1 Tax=Paenibacillus sp. GCM10027629 TaxID=3273414 RepID=UPI0036D42199
MQNKKITEIFSSFGGREMDVRLRTLNMDDYDIVLNWSKDDVFCSANGWKKDRSAEEIYKWWSNCVNNKSEDFIRKGIEYNGKLVGYVDLACIKDLSAEIGIAIGESNLWGKAIGANAAICMMDYASKELGITILNGETHKTNYRSRKMLENLGFKEISRIGDEYYMGSRTELIQYKIILTDEDT